MTRFWKCLLGITGVMLLTMIWTIRGPANTLQKIDLNGEQLSHGERRYSFPTADAAGSGNWTLKYAKLLQAAYSPQKGHINPHNYNLVLDEPTACMDKKSGSPKRVLFLVLVDSVQWNFKRRQAIRETWGSPKELGGLPVITLFLLAVSENPNLEKKVFEESAEHHDLLMEDFRDAYRNLTLKTMMAMKWASTHCPQASFVMKTDDDMYVSYQNLLNYVAVSEMPNTNVAFGLVIAGEAPIRNPGSKWYMPEELFPGDVYPPWLSGGGFVLSGDLPGKIYAASLDIRFLPLEDVFVGVCLEKLKITPIMNRQFNNLHIPYSYCRFRYIITAHFIAPDDLKMIWNEQKLQKACWPWT